MIDHVNAYGLIVRDFEKYVAFYRDKLGFKLKNKEPDFAYFVFGNETGPGLALLAIESAAKNISEARVRPREDTIHRDYFVVFLDDVDKEYETQGERSAFRKASDNLPLGSKDSLLRGPGRQHVGNLPVSQEIVVAYS